MTVKNSIKRATLDKSGRDAKHVEERGWLGFIMEFNGDKWDHEWRNTNSILTNTQCILNTGGMVSGMFGCGIGDVIEAGLYGVSGGVGVFRTDSTPAAEIARAGAWAAAAVANPLPGGSIMNLAGQKTTMLALKKAGVMGSRMAVNTSVKTGITLSGDLSHGAINDVLQNVETEGLKQTTTAPTEQDEMTKYAEEIQKTVGDNITWANEQASAAAKEADSWLSMIPTPVAMMVNPIAGIGLLGARVSGYASPDPMMEAVSGISSYFGFGGDDSISPPAATPKVKDAVEKPTPQVTH